MSTNAPNADRPPVPNAAGTSGEPRPRVAFLTMKSQLRGRIRREVTTLLARDYDVLIVGLQSKADFLQGLNHPRLEVRLLKPESIYTKGVGWTRTVLLLLTPGGRARQRELHG